MCDVILDIDLNLNAGHKNELYKNMYKCFAIKNKVKCIEGLKSSGKESGDISR